MALLPFPFPPQRPKQVIEETINGAMSVVFGLSRHISFSVLMFIHQPILGNKIFMCLFGSVKLILYLPIDDTTWFHSDNLLSVWSQV